LCIFFSTKPENNDQVVEKKNKSPITVLASIKANNRLKKKKKFNNRSSLSLLHIFFAQILSFIDFLTRLLFGVFFKKAAESKFSRKKL
jgi:hypothetical protein